MSGDGATIRERLKAEQVAAMKAGDKTRLQTIRLMLARIKDRDIELRTATAPVGDDDAMVADVLAKMVKQRRESVTMYTDGGRPELADAEAAEIAVIEDFLPAQMDEASARAAIADIVAELGATGPKDMGKVMQAVKTRLAGQIDMGHASGWVKAALTA